MSRKMPIFLLIAALTLPLRSPASDRFEIQVYDADVNPPGGLALELHFNHFARSFKEAQYPGQTPLDRTTHLTLEPALGVTDWLELGAYLQFLMAPRGVATYGGAKLRAKFVVPERLNWPVFAGINVEVGRVPREVEEEGWANEFRPIIGWGNRRYFFSFNPIFGYALTGPDAFRIDFKPAGKFLVNTDLGFGVGVEYYTALGFFGRDFLPLAEQEHVLLAVLDHMRAVDDPRSSAWEVNVAMGGGLTAASAPQFIVKMVLGRSF